MTPTRRHIKVLKTDYGKAEGWDYNNGMVAFGRKDADLKRSTNGKNKRRS